MYVDRLPVQAKAMTSVSSLNGPPRPVLAVGSGIVAGMATLAMIWGLLALTGDDTTEVATEAEPAGAGSTVGIDGLAVGDCIDFEPVDGASADYRLIDCRDPHAAEVTGIVDHPEPDQAYPGAEALTEWLGDGCDTESADYLGAPVLATTLNSGSLLPDITSWTGGSRHAVCYLSRADGATLSVPLEGQADDFGRGDSVVVSRLMAGDCFQPETGTEAYDLNSNSPVLLVDCNGEHNGVFFGRTTLDYSLDAGFPGDEEIGQDTSDRCGELFTDHFDKSPDGFNYRYWHRG